MLAQSSPSDQAKAELERFLNQPLDRDTLVNKSFSLLNWWCQHQAAFPMLAGVARKFMCVPATSTPSERVFSVAGNIVTKKRSLLLSQNVDKLIFLHMNKKN